MAVAAVEEAEVGVLESTDAPIGATGWFWWSAATLCNSRRRLLRFLLISSLT